MQRVTFFGSLAPHLARSYFPAATRAMATQPASKPAATGRPRWYDLEPDDQFRAEGNPIIPGEEQPDRNLPDVSETSEEGKRNLAAPGKSRQGSTPTDGGILDSAARTARSLVSAANDRRTSGTAIGEMLKESAGHMGESQQAVKRAVDDAIDRADEAQLRAGRKIVERLDTAEDAAKQAIENAKVHADRAQLHAGRKTVDVIEAVEDAAKQAYDGARSTMNTAQDRAYKVQRAAELQTAAALDKLDEAGGKVKEVIQGARETAQDAGRRTEAAADKLQRSAATEAQNAKAEADRLQHEAMKQLSSMRNK